MKEISRLGRYGALICLLVACSAIAGKRHYNVYREEYYFLKAQVPYTPLQVRLWGSVFSVIDIEDDFYFSNPKVHHKSYYIEPQVPRGSLPVKIRNGDEVLPLWLPSTEYRWLAGQAITPVLRYTGHDQYLATVLGDGHVLRGREEATQYLRQLRDSLLPPSYLAPHLDVVFIVWASDGRGSTTTPTPVGKASEGPLKGLPPTQEPTIRPVEIPTLPPYPSPIPGGVPSASPSFRTRTDSPPASLPRISPTPPPTSPPVAPPTFPTQAPTLPTKPPTEPPTFPTEPPTFPTDPPTQTMTSPLRILGDVTSR
ncbi:leucine-rich repeat extensin-like protein 2 [Amphibalanus amphitrite]|uniref:leucine-rich repeat extensin-like protein 2 n=1 Tax=Amphibalanus amphitrite TaxID=1232801 RepID=UPI001C922780|nr:leucine-rich repeat extensin-like protein 2 [Amphibalanus amphitrite]